MCTMAWIIFRWGERKGWRVGHLKIAGRYFMTSGFYFKSVLF